MAICSKPAINSMQQLNASSFMKYLYRAHKNSSKKKKKGAARKSSFESHTMFPLASKSLWRPTVTQDYPLSNSSHKHMLMKTFHIHFIAKLNSQIGKRHRPFHSLPHARVPSQRSAQKSQHFILSHMLKKKKKIPKPCTQGYANRLNIYANMNSSQTMHRAIGI